MKDEQSSQAAELNADHGELITPDVFTAALVPLLKQRASGREISGLSAYEQ